MIKLSDAQFNVLSNAYARGDGLAVRPLTMRPAAVAKVTASLVEKGLMKEIRAKGDAPLWRDDEDGRYALKILKAGRTALEGHAGAIAKGSLVEVSDSSSTPAESLQVREGSKRAQIIDMLRRPDGAAMDELIAATGWLPHTTRAALSGLRKAGRDVKRFRNEPNGTSMYRIVVQDEAKAA